MGRIYSIIGKSATGKDTVYREVMRTKELNLHKFVQYTTRPIRAGEENGVQYYFVSGDEQKALEKSGRIVELRAYHTVQGVWKYFTVDDGQIDLEHHDYLNLCTLESYSGIREYFGRENVVPLYIEVADDLRILRSLERERSQEHPDYNELCRRFLADQEDFSEENIRKAGITVRFSNNGKLEDCVRQVTEYIRRSQAAVQD